MLKPSRQRLASSATLDSSDPVGGPTQSWASANRSAGRRHAYDSSGSARSAREQGR